mgnify:CR=1 FL=1
MSPLERWQDDERTRIEQTVRKAFSRDSHMKEATNLGVKFTHVPVKTIHVVGEVPNEEVKERAVQIVSRNVPDGIRVDDDLTIKE